MTDLSESLSVIISTFAGHHKNSTSATLHREDPGTEKSCSLPRLKLALDLIWLWRFLCTLMLLSDVSGQRQRTDGGLAFPLRVSVCGGTLFSRSWFPFVIFLAFPVSWPCCYFTPLLPSAPRLLSYESHPKSHISRYQLLKNWLCLGFVFLFLSPAQQFGSLLASCLSQRQVWELPVWAQRRAKAWWLNLQTYVCTCLSAMVFFFFCFIFKWILSFLYLYEILCLDSISF